MEFTITFTKLFLIILYLGAPILLSLAFVITILGLIVGRREGWSTFDSIYWAFITAFTVGYGDIRPLKHASKVLAVAIAWTGIMFTGVIVAGTVAATSHAIKEHLQPAILKKVEKRFNEPG
jgi:voltage-gated potassium channel